MSKDLKSVSIVAVIKVPSIMMINLRIIFDQ